MADPLCHPKDDVATAIHDAQADGIIRRVRDEGPGLSAEDQARLVRGGVRLSPQPTTGELPSGSGLLVAKQLVEQLGGTLTIRRPAHGGFVCFFLDSCTPVSALLRGNALVL